MARLNTHGGQNEHGVNYLETYTPMVVFTTIRLILTLSIINGWHSGKLKFVLANQHAKVDGKIYMRLPKGLEIPGCNQKGARIMKLLKSFYGLKQARSVWNKQLHNRLLRLKYLQLKLDPCLYLRKDTILAVYIDNCILVAKTIKQSCPGTSRNIRNN